MISDDEREAQRERPSGRPAGFQRWRDLAFLHWPVDADAVLEGELAGGRVLSIDRHLTPLEAQHVLQPPVEAEALAFLSTSTLATA